MFDVIERLDLEVINIQIVDEYYKDGKLLLDSCFFRDDYKIENKRFQNLIEPISDYHPELFAEMENFDFSLDDVMEVLIADYDIYSVIYKVSPMNITNEEWEVLFTEIASYYSKRGIDDCFFDDMIDLNKYAIAMSLVYEQDGINLFTYLSCLKYLESDVLDLSSIMELSDVLSNAFQIDVMALNADKNGHINSLFGKDIISSLEVDCDAVDIDEVTDEIKKQLENKGFDVVDSLDSFENHKDNKCKIIDFSKYKSRHRK